MVDYIGDIGDFNPNDQYGFNEWDSNHEWDFEEREKLEGMLSTAFTLNLIKRHPK